MTLTHQGSCAACTPVPVTTVTTSIISTVTITRTTCDLQSHGYGAGPWGSNTTPAVVGRPISTPSPASFDAIQSACANAGSVILNSDFETLSSNGSYCAADWAAIASDPSVISFADAAAGVETGQHTPGGSRLAHVNTTDGSAALGLWQEVVLCTGTQYYLEAWLRQFEGVCSADFYIGNNLIFTAQPAIQALPSGAWTGYAANYVSGSTQEDVSVFVTIVVSCEGAGVLELDDVTLSYNI